MQRRILVALLCFIAASAVTLALFARGRSVRPRPSVAPETRADDVRDDRTAAALDEEHTVVPSSRSEAPPPALRGHLVDAKSGAPIAGVRVQLVRPIQAPAGLAGFLAQRSASGPDHGIVLDLNGTIDFESATNASAGNTGDQEGGSRVLTLMLRSATIPPVRPPSTDVQGANPESAQNEVTSADTDKQSLAVGTTAAPEVVLTLPTLTEPQPDAESAPPSQARWLVATAPFDSAQAEVSQTAIKSLVLVSIDQLRAEKLRESIADAWTRNGVNVVIDRSASSSDDASAVISEVNARGPDVLAERTTDAEGAFEFECPSEDGLRLDLVDEPPFYTTPRVRNVGSAASACVTPIEWRATHERRDVVHGRVVDATSGAGVADIAVEIDGGRKETVITDENGRFASEKPFRAGRIDVALHDGNASHSVNVEKSEFAFAAGANGTDELVVRAYVGALVRFEPELSADEIARGLFVRLGNFGDPNWDARQFLAHWRDDHVHDVGGTWLRLPYGSRRLSDGPITLDVCTQDGLFAGTALIDDLADVEVNPVRVRFVLRAAAIVHVKQGESDAAQSGVCLLDGAGSAVECRSTDSEGTCILRALDPTTAASIRVRSMDGKLERTLPIALVIGQASEITTDLDAH